MIENAPRMKNDPPNKKKHEARMNKAGKNEKTVGRCCGCSF